MKQQITECPRRLLVNRLSKLGFVRQLTNQVEFRPDAPVRVSDLDLPEGWQLESVETDPTLITFRLEAEPIDEQLRRIKEGAKP